MIKTFFFSFQIPESVRNKEEERGDWIRVREETKYKKGNSLQQGHSIISKTREGHLNIKRWEIPPKTNMENKIKKK